MIVTLETHIIYILDNNQLITITFHVFLQWQMAQVAKYCAKYKQDGSALTLPYDGSQERKNLFRHLIFDDERHMIFCFIPKVSAMWKTRFTAICFLVS